MPENTPEESTGGGQRGRTLFEKLVDDGMDEYEAWGKVWEIEQSGGEA